jgi:hypothetical protein
MRARLTCGDANRSHDERGLNAVVIGIIKRRVFAQVPPFIVILRQAVSRPS